MPRTQNNRGGSRRSNNNNPEGRNQYNSGLFGMVRDRPATSAAVAAGAVATGVFLWSKRAQISDQLGQLSDQIGEWTDTMSSGISREMEMAGGSNDASKRGRSGSSRSSTAGSDSSPNADNGGATTA